MGQGQGKAGAGQGRAAGARQGGAWWPGQTPARCFQLRLHLQTDEVMIKFK